MALSENDKKQEKRERPFSKVIIRRLPPTMDQETFLNQVSPVPDYNYIYTVKGDSSLGENAFSRAYMNFINPEDIYDFKERFDNYVFVDSKGGEYPAVVEFAPFQKIPKKRGKIRMDPKCATVESDPNYLEFVESLNKPKEQDEKPEYTLQLTSTNDTKNDVTTPLLEYIKNKRAQKIRNREMRREERKRREFDRRKDRFDERKTKNDKSAKASSSHAKLDILSEEKTSETPAEETPSGTTTKPKEEKSEKTEKVFEKSYYKSKDRKYDDRKKEIKLRYPKKEYADNRDFKRSDDYREREFRHKNDDYKKEEKGYQKRVKKYSEKREERKMEAAQKAEQAKSEKMQQSEKGEVKEKDSSQNSAVAKPETETKNAGDEIKTKEHKDVNKNVFEHDVKSKEENNSKKKENSESQAQRRIRNKDRPTIAIYRPGMLSKRKQVESDVPTENKDKNENKN